jgi:hypothetical protein
VGVWIRVHVEVTGKRSNSADEVLARLVDYGPISLGLALMAVAVSLAPYPGPVRWGFGIVVGVFLFAYQYLVATDPRPTASCAGVSVRWFLTGLVCGALGFYVTLSVVASMTAPTPSGLGTIGWIPLQMGLGWMTYLAVQGVRQRHSLLVSMTGILTTSAAITSLHVILRHGFGWF